LIVWQDGPKVAVEDDPVLQTLGHEWLRQSTAEHAVRDFWCWRRLFRCRRSVYVRAETGSVSPAPPPPPTTKKKPKRK
jgi:hypothetical protein